MPHKFLVAFFLMVGRIASASDSSPELSLPSIDEIKGAEETTTPQPTPENVIQGEHLYLAASSIENGYRRKEPDWQDFEKDRDSQIEKRAFALCQAIGFTSLAAKPEVEEVEAKKNLEMLMPVPNPVTRSTLTPFVLEKINPDFGTEWIYKSGTPKRNIATTSALFASSVLTGAIPAGFMLGSHLIYEKKNSEGYAGSWTMGDKISYERAKELRQNLPADFKETAEVQKKPNVPYRSHYVQGPIVPHLVFKKVLCN